ncbi:MAG: M81 family metallopeptidase [Planctomycetota bacterium]|nr:M81 family metallopeptidase [Planctomycetota bacterium]
MSGSGAKKIGRIAIGSVLTECNQFGGLPIEIERFEQYEYRRGAAVLQTPGGPVAGMLGVLKEAGATAVPLVVAATGPGGPLTKACWARLRDELLADLKAALPVEGVLLALHGSAVAEGDGHVDVDVEGEILKAARAIVGPAIPIVATLDLHAHVTEAMVANADALIAWETYPHVDTLETGQRGARMLLAILRGECRPTMAMAKVPVLTSGVRGATIGDDPFADLMRHAKSLEGRDGVLSTSVFLVHPYLDMPDMGSGGLVITDGDMPKAVRLAEDLAVRYWARRKDLEPPTWTPAEAIARGLKVAGGPVLLVETADCNGGGAAGDSVATIKALVEANVAEPALAMVVDPEAARACHAAGVGAAVTLQVGHKLDPRWGKPTTLRGRVEKLSDGKFQYTGGVWGGTWSSMGPTALLACGAAGNVKVLVTTLGTYDWADEQFRSMGLDASTMKFVVAKNPMNYRFAYAGIAKEALILDTPGPTPATVKHFKYRHRVGPWFPADAEIPGLKPRVMRGRTP